MVKIIAEGCDGKYTINQLLTVMEALRSPGGCPWDMEQTHSSIKNDALEEVYEVVDAIDTGDIPALCEELGDMLLQVVFHSQIVKEESEFTFEDVVDGICKKLILRHPHVFGSESVNNSSEVLNLWDSIKQKEKNQTTVTSTLESVPKAFPALMRAAKVQKRAKKAGVIESVTANQVANSINAFNLALSTDNKEQQKQAYGNLLFSLAGISETLGFNAEEVLNCTTNTFIDGVKKSEL